MPKPTRKKPAANKAKPPRPVKKQDVKDIERADSEGMAQPQGVPPEKSPRAAAKPPAAAAPGRRPVVKGRKGLR